MSQRGRRYVLVCALCDEIFTRRTADTFRGDAAGPFCGKACVSAWMRRGRRVVQVTCSGCRRPFGKRPAEVKRSQKHFCSRACYDANVDRRAQGLASAASARRHGPVSPLVRFLRAQAAGRARARNLSPERLREIALMGVAARRATGALGGRAAGAGRQVPVSRADVRLGLSWLGPVASMVKGEGSE